MIHGTRNIKLLNISFTKLRHGMLRGVKILYGVVLVAVRSYSEGENTHIQKKLLIQYRFKNSPFT